MKLYPQNKHVIVRSLTEDQLESGLEVPSGEADTRPCYGQVVACAPQSGTEDAEFEAGEIVCFDRYESRQIDIRGERFYGVLAERVIGVVEFD